MVDGGLPLLHVGFSTTADTPPADGAEGAATAAAARSCAELLWRISEMTDVLTHAGMLPPLIHGSAQPHTTSSLEHHARPPPPRNSSAGFTVPPLCPERLSFYVASLVLPPDR